MSIEVLVYVVTTLFTYLMGKASKRFGWNYDLPIPIQNIIIGFIAAGIGILIHIEGLDANTIIQSVIVALGGVGTAVIAYDAKNK